MNTAFIIGTGGQVARALRLELEKKGIEHISTSSSAKPGAIHLDLSDSLSIEKAFFETSKQHKKLDVYLPGALTHVDRCEQEQELCRKINLNGPLLVAEQCKKYGYKLIYFSSEYVFGEDEYLNGKVGPFKETDKPNPTSYYGKCKLDAEEGILRILGDKNSLIVRTTMIFSWDPKGMNFFMQLFRYLEKLQAGETPAQEFRIPVDQISTPTYAEDLAQATLAFVEKDEGGIVHIVGKDLLSRKQFLEKIIEAFGFDTKKSLEAFKFLKTKDLGQVAKRPLTAGLLCERAKKSNISLLSMDRAFDQIKRKISH